MEMLDLNLSLQNEALHVACDFPFLPAITDCLTGHFKCSDGTCVLEHYICDGVVDCPDNSDEIDCDRVCTFSHVASGEKDCFTSCIPGNCSCSDIYFQCHLGGCVPWSRVCDAIEDCPSKEDEQVCDLHHIDKLSNKRMLTKHVSNFLNEVQEVEETFHCNSGGDIPHNLENDVIPDCLDQSDETEYNNFLLNGSKHHLLYTVDVVQCGR